MGFGTQLSLDHLPPIQWLAHRGMLWDRLMPALFKALMMRCQPEVLLLHLAESDLVTCSAFQFLKRLVEVITSIQRLLPRARLVWADMLPRVWSGTHNPKAG